jgi:chemotaxis protein histidine kinase CheA
MALNIMQFLARFVEEAREHVKTLNEGLLSLEKNPGDSECLNGIFRAAHTLKGSSRMMKLTAIGDVAHKLEEVLESVRGGRLSLSRELSDLLFSSVDTISAMVEEAADGGKISLDTRTLCVALEKAARCDPTGAPDGAGVDRDAGSGGGSDSTEGKRETEGKKGTEGAGAPFPQPSVSGEPSHREIPDSPRAKVYETIRVGTAKLDELIKLVGEMTTGQQRLRQRLAKIRELEKRTEKCIHLSASFGNGHSSLGKEMTAAVSAVHSGLKRFGLEVAEEVNMQELLVRQLQGSSLSLRMVPLSSLFDPLHRTVRDLASSLGRKINFIVEGGETELDKKMAEKLGDPLVHMIRNGVDHGIESPEDRLKAGKDETGTLRLAARYEGDTVLIELSDDGAGISVQNIKKKAIRKKLFTEDQLERLPESEVINLIFHPGFSTSEIITDISGRGVGMDVVKRNIAEHLKGSIRIETEEGKGTIFTVRLLLTLAIMRVLVVSVSGMKFAVPSNSVEEIVRVRENEIIDVVNRKAIRLREQLVPVVSLGRVLRVPRLSEEDSMGRLCLICSMGREKLGLMVEEVLDEEDVVIKPLPAHMQNARFVSGAISSGMDEIINVLNVPIIAEAAREMKHDVRLEPRAMKKARIISILVVDDSVNTREIERGVLEAYGYSVTLAGDGLEALEKAGEAKYDAIVTDVEMPRMDGFTFTERLRQDETYKDTPIILVTSRDKEEDKRRGIKVGANAYIVKGAFDQTNLVETIRNLVG